MMNFLFHIIIQTKVLVLHILYINNVSNKKIWQYLIIEETRNQLYMLLPFEYQISLHKTIIFLFRRVVNMY